MTLVINEIKTWWEIFVVADLHTPFQLPPPQATNAKPERARLGTSAKRERWGLPIFPRAPGRKLFKIFLCCNKRATGDEAAFSNKDKPPLASSYTLTLLFLATT